MLGVRFREVLHGGFYLLSDPVDERAADLTLDVEIQDATSFAPSYMARLRGAVALERFVDDARIEGKATIAPEQKRVTYEVSFRTGDGTPYRLRGYQQLEVLNLVDSFTLIRGSLYDANAREIGRTVVRLDARGAWRDLLRSIRVYW
jgi:hypothetical protein